MFTTYLITVVIIVGLIIGMTTTTVTVNPLTIVAV